MLLLLLLLASIWLAIACLAYTLAVAAAKGDAIEGIASTPEDSRRFPT